MLRRGTAATAVDVYQPFLEHLASYGSKGFGCLVISTHHVRQTSVGVNGDGAVGYLGKAMQPRQQLFCAKAAVKSYAEQVGVRQRSIVSLNGLP